MRHPVVVTLKVTQLLYVAGSRNKVAWCYSAALHALDFNLSS